MILKMIISLRRNRNSFTVIPYYIKFLKEQSFSYITTDFIPVDQQKLQQAHDHLITDLIGIINMTTT